jgi:signal transduction histidine kinase
MAFASLWRRRRGKTLPPKELALRQTEDDLRAANERLSLALRAGRAGFFDWNMKDGTILGSPELNDLFETPPDAPCGSFKAWASRVLPEDRLRIKAALRQCVQTGRLAFDFELRVLTSHGWPRWLACQSRVSYGPDGKPVRLMGVVIDVTRRQQAENARKALNQELERRVEQRTAAFEQANGELESFARSVSHDLCKPLRAIHGFSRILLDEYGDKFDEEGLRRLRIVNRAAGHMSKLIDDLLNLSCLSRRPLYPEVLDVRILALDVYENLRFRDPARDIRLTIGETPPVRCDRALLRHVLEQLLANAVRFTVGREKAEIELSGVEEGGELVYAVKDNGVGFDMSNVHKLFQVFKRMHAGDGFEGTGIGLAIVKRAMELQGGRVWADAKPDQGATFYFAFPVERGLLTSAQTPPTTQGA